MDRDLLDIFRSEAAERIERMTELLLVAETDGADAGAVDALFRDAHSIRGSAGMFGFDEIGELAETIEAVLADARGQGRLEAAQVPELLATVGRVRAAIREDPPASASASASAPAPGAPEPSSGPTPAASPVPASRSMRVDAEKVDRLLTTVGETALHRWRLEHLVAPGGGDERVVEELDHGRVLVDDLQDAVLDMRTLPLDTIAGVLRRSVRDVAAAAGRTVRLDLQGTDVQLDRTILEGAGEALVHLLRNAVSHGIEPPDERRAAGKPQEGRIVISATQLGSQVAITCGDDGRGVAPELVARAGTEGSLADILSPAGFSTADEVSDLSGHGVGLDAVKRHVESLGGALQIDSESGVGTDVTMLLPLTLAITRMFIFERDGACFGLPLAAVRSVLAPREVHRLQGRVTIEVEDRVVPLVDLADVLEIDAPVLPDDSPAVVVEVGGRQVAVRCDGLHGDQETVVKSLGPLLAGMQGYIGATVLGDGAIALLLDPAHLIRVGVDAQPRERQAVAQPAVWPKILVVDDQLPVRELERTILEGAGYRVVTAADGRSALAVLEREGDVDCVVSDIQMPVMDGLLMLEQIRNHPAFANLPVVVVTSREDETSRSRGADSGADAWVLKSRFEQRALLDAVESLVPGP